MHDEKAHTRIKHSQNQFADALTWRVNDVPQDVTARNADIPVKRFNVYRNNVFVSLTSAIASKFPVIERLVGTEFASAMARVYVENNLPTSPVMLNYGVTYPDFLKTFEPIAHRPFMADVAQLEWLRLESYHSANAQHIGIEQLGLIAPEELANVRFDMLPCVRLIASQYPIVSIWHTNTHDDDVQAIEINAREEAALIVRPHLDVLITPLKICEFIFINALNSGKTLDEAATQACEREPHFALDQALIKLFHSGAVLTLNSQPTEISP